MQRGERVSPCIGTGPERRLRPGWWCARICGVPAMRLRRPTVDPPQKSHLYKLKGPEDFFQERRISSDGLSYGWVGLHCRRYHPYGDAYSSPDGSTKDRHSGTNGSSSKAIRGCPRKASNCPRRKLLTGLFGNAVSLLKRFTLAECLIAAPSHLFLLFLNNHPNAHLQAPFGLNA